MPMLSYIIIGIVFYIIMVTAIELTGGKCEEIPPPCVILFIIGWPFFIVLAAVIVVGLSPHFICKVIRKFTGDKNV